MSEIQTAYPATVVVHWPSGPVPCCDRHAVALLRLGNFLGSHVVATFIATTDECVNCASEAEHDAAG